MAHIMRFCLGKYSYRNVIVKAQQFFQYSSRCASCIGIKLDTKNANLKDIKRSYIIPFNIQPLNGQFFQHTQNLTTSVTMFKKKKSAKNKTPLPEETDEDLEKSIIGDTEFESLKDDFDALDFKKFLSGSAAQVGVIVLQPWVKWGPKMKRNTSAPLMLAEATTLVSTLPGVEVLSKEVVPVKSLEGNTIFGSGTLARLVSEARNNKLATSLFVSVDMLKRRQIEELQEAFGMRVWDRYSVVLGIFQHNARTREAKLQVALAELPYMRKRVTNEKERLLIMEREKRIRKALDRLAGNRELNRRARVKSNVPTVAIVGYTNSGKTSLIRAITGDKRAEGKNSLFATLDVTAHGGHLPCGLEVAFIDTVGFIQDIPTDLVASFRATLEDAICADVVVHVRDASHPDYVLQGLTVSETLSSLPLPDDTPIISIANKADLELVKPEDEFAEEYLLSATSGKGVMPFLERLEEVVLRVTGRRSWRFSLPTGSPEIQWLRNVTGILSEEMDLDDPQITKIVAVLTDHELAVYNRNFRKSRSL